MNFFNKKKEKEKVENNMNFDLIEILENDIKICQNYDIEYNTIDEFNGWKIFKNDMINSDYIVFMYYYKDFENIKLVIKLYKEKIFKRYYYKKDYIINYYIIFENIEIVKFCIEIYGDEFLCLDSDVKRQLIEVADLNDNCINLLYETYGKRLYL